MCCFSMVVDENGKINFENVNDCVCCVYYKVMKSDQDEEQGAKQ